MPWKLPGLWRPRQPVYRRSPGRRCLRLESLEPRLVPADLPTGFSETLLATGLDRPTGMALAPDGRVFVSLQAGEIRIIKDGTLLPTPFLSLEVNADGEHGLKGVAFDPDFATNGHVYVYYTTTSPTVHNRVSRFTADGDVVLPGSETPILDLEPLVTTDHDGGALQFGPDGKLYVSVGDNAVSANAQSLDTRLGKMLRLEPDGTIPPDNPFYNQAAGPNRAIWALGLRNPFAFTFQPGTGRMFIHDVGELTWEEINEGAAGSNYGWPGVEGPGAPSDTTFRNPLYVYQHDGLVCAITGGAFYNPQAEVFPPEYAGTYFFADLCGGWIKRLDPATGAVTDFATSISGPVDLKVSADGFLYYLAYSDGQLYRVEYPAAGGNQAPVLDAVGDRVLSADQAVLDLPLSATDPDGNPLSYSVSAQSLAYVLDQRLALYSPGDLYENWGGRGEKWVRGAGGLWYFILPDGGLYRWDGTAGQATGVLVGTPGASYHADPRLLYEATPDPRATLTLSGNLLTIQREAGFVGAFVVTVAASDGSLADHETFTVTVTAAPANRPPVLQRLGDLTLPSRQETLSVSLSASDPDGDLVGFTATAQSLAYVLSQSFGPFAYSPESDNFYGQEERWFRVGGQWYFLLRNGELFRWDGGDGLAGSSLGVIGSSYYQDPGRLEHVQPDDAHVSLSLSGNTLTVTRDLSWVSAVVILVTTSDGRGGTDTGSFTIVVLA